jgi:hypothetical protein
MSNTTISIFWSYQRQMIKGVFLSMNSLSFRIIDITKRDQIVLDKEINEGVK